MQIHINRVRAEEDQPFLRFLCSDLHIGSSSCAKEALVADLTAAQKAHASILINGDAFDAITHNDPKRYKPSALDKSLWGLDDVGAGILDLGFALLEPFAESIDVFGCGNHEEAYTKYHGVDLTKLMIDRLNASLEKQGSAHRVRHGGIQGYVRTTFEIGPPDHKGRQRAVNHDLLYQHGAGGGSPVTKEAIRAFRALCGFEYDALTFGHAHHRTFGYDTTLYLSPKGHLRQKDRLYVQTASYFWNYQKTDQSAPLNYSYAESKHHAPKPIGGMFLTMTPTRTCRKTKTGTTSLYWVKQDVSTSAPTT